jgi:hypothetical protein
LAVLLGKNKTLSYRKASDIVNLYCDERAPAIPHYLGNEFMIPYLKMISLLPGALAVIVVIVTVVRFHSNVNAPGFLWGLILAGLLLTLGVLAYIRSLVREFSSED